MGWQLKRIAAAVDGSEQSIHAAQRAVDLAGPAGGRVTLLTVVRPPEGWWGLDGLPPSPEALAEAVAAGLSEVLDRVQAQVQAGDVAVDTVEELGDPAATIMAFCEREQIDLLVVGRRGAGVVERMMLGSVADRLAHHSPCPVLIVP